MFLTNVKWRATATKHGPPGSTKAFQNDNDTAH